MARRIVIATILAAGTCLLLSISPAGQSATTAIPRSAITAAEAAVAGSASPQAGPSADPFSPAFRIEDFASFPQPSEQNAAMVAAIQRGRLLENARFEVPISLYLGYLRSKDQPVLTAPVPYILQEGIWGLTVGADNKPALTARIQVQVFDPRGARNLPLLDTRIAWE